MMLMMEYAILVFAVWNLDFAKGEDCWDGVNSAGYAGRVSTTSSGITCQAWASDFPNSHSRHEDYYFPHDGTDDAASNYCRDPEGSNGAPWCYTTNEDERKGECNVPICSNLPCTGVTTMEVGQPVPVTIGTTLQDNYGSLVLIRAADSRMLCCGTVSEWRVFPRRAGNVALQVWRETADPDILVLVGENIVDIRPGEEDIAQVVVSVALGDRISVGTGDYIAWYSSGQESIPFIGTAASHPVWRFTPSTALSVDSMLQLTGYDITADREFSIGAILAASVTPYFTNTVYDVTVYANATVSSIVYTVQYTDDDPGDIASLSVTMEISELFEFLSPDVRVRGELVLGTYVLSFHVIDRCGSVDTMDVNVNVQPPPVAITSLPEVTSVSETTSTQTLLHVLAFSPIGMYTCSLDYSPIRPEGNPFMVQDTPDQELGIYLQDNANILFNVTPVYNVSVTCTALTSATDTDFLLVSVQPNTVPVFVNFQASAVIPDTMTAGSAVYAVTVTDSQPLSLTLLCDPADGPFTVASDGTVILTSHAPSAGSAFTWIFTADDSFDSVTSPTVTVIIKDASVPPRFLSATYNADVPEGASLGATGFRLHWTAGSADRSVYSFTAMFEPHTCSLMFDVTGELLTNNYISLDVIKLIDYETDVTSCNVTLTLGDDQETSAPVTLRVEVVDVDEAPVWSRTAYYVTTEEVPNYTPLTVPDLTAADPENAAVTYALDCGEHSVNLNIDATSGQVTMVAAFDLDTTFVDTYTLQCSAIASDVTNHASSVPLYVTVTDVNDKAPIFSAPVFSFFVLNETLRDISQLDRVLATDTDRTSPNNDVTYSGDSANFAVNEEGIIFNTEMMANVLPGKVFQFNVTATDGGVPGLSSQAKVFIYVVSSLPEMLTTTTPALPQTSQSTESDTQSLESDSGSGDDGPFPAGIFAVGLLMLLTLVGGLGLVVWKLCFSGRPQITPDLTSVRSDIPAKMTYVQPSASNTLANNFSTQPGPVKPTA